MSSSSTVTPTTLLAKSYEILIFRIVPDEQQPQIRTDQTLLAIEIRVQNQLESPSEYACSARLSGSAIPYRRGSSYDLKQVYRIAE
ncbi:hypothetical protein T265_00066 [Opisthorchis viverrini]|uniref:Uncharacterized protein n=1 Tax=Opisthorchis viverrini TaxID=6198 RepID=A0A075A3G9_OPIVI|nr:hypothetical protein T265_00066 [Opisthorchis viverrini]KER34203.1 hypothetical protein T265_00066 [Opisthorchis viverrini]